MIPLIRNLVCAVGIGILVWLIAHAALLPVVDVGDGQGHGPDVGSAEWTSAVVHQTKAKERRARAAGLIGSIAALPVLWLTMRFRRSAANRTR